MHWLRSVKLSFPGRVTLIIILVLVTPIVFFVTRYFSFGYVTFAVDKPDGWVVIDGETYDTPHSAWIKSGRRTFYFGALGYDEEKYSTAVWPFRLSKKVDYSLTQKLLYEDDEDGLSQLEFEANNRWATELPFFQTGQYEIAYPDPDGTIRVTFLIRPGNYLGGDRDKQYREALKQTRKLVVKWFEAKKVDTNLFRVEWSPFDPDA